MKTLNGKEFDLELIYPKGKYPVTVISGMSNFHKNSVLWKFSNKHKFVFYEEQFTCGLMRIESIFNFCKDHNEVIIRDIELYLPSYIQEKVLLHIFSINKNIKIICTTHSPSIIIDGWLDKVFNMTDYFNCENYDIEIKRLFEIK